MEMFISIVLPDVWAHVASLVVMVAAYGTYWMFIWRRESER